MCYHNDLLELSVIYSEFGLWEVEKFSEEIERVFDAV